MSRYVYIGLFSRAPHRTVNSRKMKMMAVDAAEGSAAVDDQRRRGVTGTAGAAVSLEDPFPLAAEAGAVAAAAAVAELARPATKEFGLAAGAERRQLDLVGRDHERSAGFSQAPAGAAPCGTTGRSAARSGAEMTVIMPQTCKLPECNPAISRD